MFKLIKRLHLRGTRGAEVRWTRGIGPKPVPRSSKH